MALTELTALDNAYKALQPLGQDARRRALQWLSDALNGGHALADAPAAAEPPGEAVEVTETAAPAFRQETAAVASTSPAPKPRRGRRVRGGTAQPKAEQPPAEAGRAYRRMPDPEVIMKAYRKVGTVSGLADRFDVPRHTVNHWARRLRSQGYDIGRAQ